MPAVLPAYFRTAFMSRAGKFIPGGSGRKASGALPKGGGADPIRAPEEPMPDAPRGQRKLFPKGGLRSPVPKKNRLPITIMSAVFLALGVWLGQYILVSRPAQQRAIVAEHEQQIAQAALAADQARQKEQAEADAKAKASLITVKIDSNPTGATVTLGDVQKTTPTTFDGVAPGPINLTIHLAGYKDYHQSITAAAGQPLDLGVIALAHRTGSMALSSPVSGLTYTLSGPDDYTHTGSLPDKLNGLPVGVYQLAPALGDWRLPVQTLTLHPDENLQQVVTPPYATCALASDPPGATVRNGRDVLGQTPMTLTNQRPGTLHLSVDLPPYTMQLVDIDLGASANVDKTVTLTKDRDFIAACGMPMIWIPEGKFWAAKYPMVQSEFEVVAKYNPSFFRNPNRPVESISWDNANAFCDTLTDFERAAGRLPHGYKYSLPTETQWSRLNDDANIDLGATSRINPLSSTQDVGYSAPNKYGIYDTLGNVWEWCLDSVDDQGDHSLRGGSWLSSTDNFPTPDTRIVAVPKNADKFTGFRVVLVPQ
jgi:hypothetical protein